MTDAIGGYFGLELRKGQHYHQNALRLNTGRNCFEYILRARKYTHVYIPYYTCEVMLEPLQKLHIPYSFYSIDHLLEPAFLPELKQNEAFVYTNYYGLKQTCVERLSNQYGQQLVVDNSQAFFAPRIDKIDTFYTARKFFGVPDGAYLYTEATLDKELPQDISVDRMSHLLKRLENGAESGFADYQKQEEELCEQSIKKMSMLTERILKSIDYEMVKQQRRDNYLLLHNSLRETNGLSLEIDNAIPMVYPYLTEKGDSLRRLLQRQRIYIATYWPNVLKWSTHDSTDYRLASQILPLPIDQRYGEEDIKKIIDILS